MSEELRIVIEMTFFCDITDLQVMQTERLIYLVTEYASGGEIFGKFSTFPEQILIGLHTSVDCFNA